MILQKSFSYAAYECFLLLSKLKTFVPNIFVETDTLFLGFYDE